MNTIKMTCRSIKADNGSGYRLAHEFPTRRFHDATIYVVHYTGIQVDRSTITRIERSRSGSPSRCPR